MVRCLIVDDSTRFLEVARVVLERDGIAVVGMASNGSEALGAAAVLRPDVTLVDIDLGAESGFAVAGQLAQQSGGVLPVILISAHTGEDYAELVAASPVVGFLPKTSLSGRAVRDLLEGANGLRGR